MIAVMNRYYLAEGRSSDNSENGSWDAKPTLLYEIVGLSDESVREQMAIVANIGSAHGCINNIVLTDKSECKELWKRRKECIWAGSYISSLFL